MKSELLIEQLTPVESNIIVEYDQQESTKHLWLNGIFMQSSIKNRNGRVYPLNEISKAVDFAQQKIKESNGIFGELDHPQTLTINLDRISHVITEMKMVGNDCIGKAKIIPTPMGTIAKTLIESGVRIGVSSRGAGQINESIVTDFNFITVDLVAVPSAPNAMPNSIYESLELNQHGRNVLTLSECVLQDPKAQEYFKKNILKFLTSMDWKSNK